MTTRTITKGVRPRAGGSAGLRVCLLSGAAALALASCSWPSGFDSAAGTSDAQQVAQAKAGTPAKVTSSPLAPRPTMSEPGTAWPSAVRWVQSQARAPEEAPPTQSAAETAAAPATWERGMTEPLTWTEPSEAARDNDDEVLQLAAAPVEGEELSEQRGGFVTDMGPIDIGFDIQTFVDGQLQVRNIFNLVGSIAEKAQDKAGIGNGLTVRFGNGGGFTVTPPSNNNSSNNSNNNSSNNNTNTNTNTNTTPPDTNVPNTETVNTPPPPQPNVVVSELADGHIQVVNELNGGDTKIINEIRGGAAHTTLVNTASGLNIEHITNLVVGFSSPSNIVNTVRSGFKTNGDLSVGNGMRSALIGAISR